MPNILTWGHYCKMEMSCRIALAYVAVFTLGTEDIGLRVFSLFGIFFCLFIKDTLNQEGLPDTPGQNQ